MAESSNNKVSSNKLQESHYDEIALDYQSHYDCPNSQKYRNRFMYQPLFEHSDLKGKTILEAMCGSGQATSFLLSKGAKVTGLDVSSSMIDLFKKRWPNCDGICQSFFCNRIEDDSFDCIVIIGGLHHLQPNVNDAIDEVYRILKPKGNFYFIEPNSGSLPNIFRNIWMKADPLFEDNEKAIDISVLQKEFESKFNFVQTRYGGGISYMLVLNSMVLRIPLFIKPLISSITMFIESVFNFLHTKRFSCFVIGQWQKK